ncbi:hypothetical protein J6590_044575 [Homalodisca vitripennis]|nr:hypothetical protein J6590_044575 [Homalodisca vitripennis]
MMEDDVEGSEQHQTKIDCATLSTPCVNCPDQCTRPILSTMNVKVKEINDIILNSIVGRLHELRSTDAADTEKDDHLHVDVPLLNQDTSKGVLRSDQCASS